MAPNAPRKPFRFSFSAAPTANFIVDIGEDRDVRVDPSRRGRSYGRRCPSGTTMTGVVTARWACGPARGRITERMKKISYAGYRFPPEVIHQAIWLYLRFTLSFRDVEDLLAERGLAVSYETVRRWVNHFGPMIAADLRKRRQKPHTTWHLDEVYLKIDGRMSTCGGLSTRKARSSMCWSNPSETSTPR